MSLNDFILSHRTADVHSLALNLKGFTPEESRYILCQVEGWQRLKDKVPSWAAVDELHYPARLPLEQCSGEEAARYKAGLLSGGDLFVDLTGGLGVDFSFMARGFKEAVYVERDEALCFLAHHNFPLLGLSHATVIHGDDEAYLRTMPTPADVIFLDPFRRDEAGKKTVFIEDCTPNVIALLPLLCEKTRRLIVKLSPMLDITAALHSLASSEARTDVHVVGSGGEVKEVLFDVDFSQKPADSPKIFCHDGTFSFSFSLAEEQGATACAALPPSTGNFFLFEPCSALMKAGPFRLLAQRFGLAPLHANSHLYFGPHDVEDFPGRRFRVNRMAGLSKAEQKQLRGQQMNLAVRNFPLSVAQLRARLHLLDGGAQYGFATTLADGSHALLLCEKAKADTP